MSGMSSINGNYSPQATELLSHYGVSTGGSANGADTEQMLQEILNMLSSALAQLKNGGQDSSGSAPPMSSGAPVGGAPAGGAPGGNVQAASTPAAGGAGGAAGAMGAGGSPAGAGMNPQSASGALAGYMGTNSNDAVDMNDLYKLAQGQAAGGNGQTPSPQVQQAAQYMLSNPSVYNQIETHDVGGADGKSSATNFQNAAQGNFPITAPASSGMPATAAASGMPAAGAMPASTGAPAAPLASSGSSGGAMPASTGAATGAASSGAMNPQSASGALGGYMGTNGNDALNVNDLYNLSLGQAAGGNGQQPSAQVQQAAQYMLSNPGVFNQIETHDVSGADGKSGAANFDNAAQGDFAINAPATGGAAAIPATSTGAMPPATMGATPAAASGNGMNSQTAAGALAGYMGTNGNNTLDVNDLYKLSQGQGIGQASGLQLIGEGNGQQPSPEVQQAAQYMLANPGEFKQIETHDVAGTDGLSGVSNFQNAAQGLV
jgi:hypothetical protein